MPIQKTTPDEIIKNSIRVFRASGYYRTTMSDLAKATGLTKGIFYHHFTNKEDVMKKALRNTSLWFQHKVFSIAYDENLSYQERLVKMADVLFIAFSQNEGGCFFANTILETVHIEDTFLEEIKAFFDLFEKALANIFQEKYNDDALKQIINQIIADIEGTIIMMQFKKEPELLRNALNRAINLF